MASGKPGAVQTFSTTWNEAMTFSSIVISLVTLAVTVTLLVVALIRGGAQKQGLDQAFLDDEQAKAIKKWTDAR